MKSFNFKVFRLSPRFLGFSFYLFTLFMRSLVPIFISVLFLLAGEGSLLFPAWRAFFLGAALFAGAIALFTWQLRFLPTLLLTALVVGSGIAFFLFAFPTRAGEEYFNVLPHIFVAVWAFILLLALGERVRASRGLSADLNRIQAIIYVSLFLLYASAYSSLGSPFFMQGWMVLLVIAVAAYVAMFIRLEGHTRMYALGVPERRLMAYSAAASFLLTQMFLVVSFWPFAPLRVAAVLVVVDYCIANIFIRFFRATLRPLDIIRVVAVVGATMVVLLAQSPWLVVSH